MDLFIYWIPLVLLAISPITSWLHAYQEIKENLWKYFQELIGAKITVPTILGIVTLLVLPIILSICAQMAYWEQSKFFMGILLGARIGDTLFSHWIPSFFKKENPGLETSVIYAVESALILLLQLAFSWEGFIVGFLPFLLLLPTYWIIDRSKKCVTTM